MKFYPPKISTVKLAFGKSDSVDVTIAGDRKTGGRVGKVLNLFSMALLISSRMRIYGAILLSIVLAYNTSTSAEYSRTVRGEGPQNHLA